MRKVFGGGVETRRDGLSQVGPWQPVRRATQFGVDPSGFPNVAAHFKRMQERPSVKKLLAYEKAEYAAGLSEWKSPLKYPGRTFEGYIRKHTFSTAEDLVSIRVPKKLAGKKVVLVDAAEYAALKRRLAEMSDALEKISRGDAAYR